MAQLIEDLNPERIAENLGRVREEIDAATREAGRRGEEVQILAATKYVPCGQMGKLAAAGIALVGENRAQDLERKIAVHVYRVRQRRFNRRANPHRGMLDEPRFDQAAAGNSQQSSRRALRIRPRGTKQETGR